MSDKNYKIFVSGHMASHDSASKAKIRKKAAAKSDKPVVIIPAKSEEELRKTQLHSQQHHGKLRVAAYCRVSTPSESQVQSIENQEAHFEELIKSHDDWDFVGIYADEGISGTCLKRRKALNKLIEDCHRQLIDLILIKDVARYTRNVVDGLSIARTLRNLKPPVYIYFETSNLSTQNPDYETLLTLIATTTQAESVHKSEAIKWSYKHRFENGKFPCPTYYLLGYDTDEDGNMVINQEEAKTVEVIFYAYCLGFSIASIAECLTKAHRRTGWKGRDEDGNIVYNTCWNRQTVINILENERYCGDALGQKTYTVDALEHKTVKNDGKYPQYFIANHHDGIVTHEVFEMAQRILKTESFRHRETCNNLELSVVPKGLLRGFIPLNSFAAIANYEEYLRMCESVAWKEDNLSYVELPKVNGFYSLRSMFGERNEAVKLLLTNRKITPSKNLFSLMSGVEYFEVLLHPTEYLLAIRKTTQDNPNAIQWASWENCKFQSLTVKTGSMSETIYDLMNWNRSWRFSCEGYHRTKGKDTVVIFDLRDTVAYIPICEYGKKSRKSKVLGEGKILGWNKPIFPYHWKENIYGENFLNKITKCRMHMVDYFNIWDIDAQAIKIETKKNPVSPDDYRRKLAELTPQTDFEEEVI